MEYVSFTTVQLHYSAILLIGKLAKAYAAFLHLRIFWNVILSGLFSKEIIQTFPRRKLVLRPLKGIEKLIVRINIEADLLEAEEDTIREAEKRESYSKNDNGNEPNPYHATYQCRQFFVLPVSEELGIV